MDLVLSLAASPFCHIPLALAIEMFSDWVLTVFPVQGKIHRITYSCLEL